MVRAAAKNFASVGVVVGSGALRRDRGRAPPRGRPDARDASRSAADAFAHTAAYDAAVAGWFAEQGADGSLPGFVGLAYEKIGDLRYGENPHQRGALYAEVGGPGVLGGANVLQGKEMSFNNWLDVDAAYALASALPVNAAVIVKHNNPCGVAVRRHPGRGVREGVRVRRGLGVRGHRGVPRPVRRACRRGDGRRVHRGRRRTGVHRRRARGVRRPEEPPRGAGAAHHGRGTGRASDRGRRARAGPRPRRPRRREEWKVVSSREPTDEEWDDLAFAWTVAWRVKSNAIVFAQGRRHGGRGGRPDVARRRGVDRGAQGRRPREGRGRWRATRSSRSPTRSRSAADAGVDGRRSIRVGRCATRTSWPSPRRGAWRSWSPVAGTSVTEAGPQVGFRSVTARILDGKAVAAQIRTEIADRVRALVERGVTPGLAAVLVGDDQASRIYVGSKHKACADVGHPFGAGRPARLRDRGRAARHDPPPEPRPRDPRDHRAAADAAAHQRARGPEDDRSGEGRRRPASARTSGSWCAASRRSLRPRRTASWNCCCARASSSRARRSWWSATASSSARRSRSCSPQDSIRGNATVTCCHVKTRDLAEHTRRADILVAAAGVPEMISGDMIKPGATVDRRRRAPHVGRAWSATCGSTRSIEVAGAITPVPGGCRPDDHVDAPGEHRHRRRGAGVLAR